MTLETIKPEELQAKLRALDEINDPYLGAGSAARFEAESKLWPGELYRRIALVSVASGDGRTVEEYMYFPADGHRPALPVAIVYDGNKARIYSDHHLVAERAPILPVSEEAYHLGHSGEFFGGYFGHLAAADLDGVMSDLEYDGYLQHSDGDRFRGDRLRQDFVTMFKNNGGKIQIKYANFFDDGRMRVMEVYMPSGRPAVACYERGPTGKLAAIRLYL